ncbi:hypothetical protein [Microbacterium sp.]|uniref:hypothetical protein n=1 Tax=Microbacterium sp. TaxID=51671 RepID=UPI0027350EE0|nr:hypothetical protein [Microbacterium sp.]MDP3950187.1 hypothetical protein [Microbacterium sp.]
MDDNDEKPVDKAPRRRDEHASEVETFVVEARGEWHVEILVLFDDEMVRRRVGTYRTEKLAIIAADLIKRTAERDISGPIHG